MGSFYTFFTACHCFKVLWRGDTTLGLGLSFSKVLRSFLKCMSGNRISGLGCCQAVVDTLDGRARKNMTPKHPWQQHQHPLLT